MAVDVSKLVSIPEMYRFVRTEVPLGWLLAPVTAWALLGGIIAWAGGVIWSGIAMPVVLIIQGGVSLLPAGQLGSSLLAASLFVIAMAAIARLTQHVLALHERVMDVTGDIVSAMKDFSADARYGFDGVLTIQQRSVDAFSAQMAKIEQRLHALESNRQRLGQ